MNSRQLRSNLGDDARMLEGDLARDLKAEYAHVTDPSQCGVVVRGHFTGLVIILYLFIFLFLLAAVAAIAMYMRHGF